MYSEEIEVCHKCLIYQRSMTFQLLHTELKRDNWFATLKKKTRPNEFGSMTARKDEILP